MGNHGESPPEIAAFMQQPNGGRLRSFGFQGFKVMVEAHSDDAAQERFTKRLVAWLAGQPAPSRLIGPGCVRFDIQGRLWLLSKREQGWAAFGVVLVDWDDLFRRYDVRVTGTGKDEIGTWWTVESFGPAADGR